MSTPPKVPSYWVGQYKNRTYWFEVAGVIEEDKGEFSVQGFDNLDETSGGISIGGTTWDFVIRTMHIKETSKEQFLVIRTLTEVTS